MTLYKHQLIPITTYGSKMEQKECPVKKSRICVLRTMSVYTMD